MNREIGEEINVVIWVKLIIKIMVIVVFYWGYVYV